jgi:hypothetical protein
LIEDLRLEVWLVVVRKLPTPEGPDPALGTPGQWVAGTANGEVAERLYGPRPILETRGEYVSTIQTIISKIHINQSLKII